jgi:biopolymer transport protein ExbB
MNMSDSIAEWVRSLEQYFFELIDAGGPVMWGIFGVSMLMWLLIVQRYWFVIRIHPHYARKLAEYWKSREDRHSWCAYRIRESIIDEATLRLTRHLTTIRCFASVLPMLGLLGTVTGMIRTFDVLTVFGAGNPRAMASGVSEALITTLGGLVAALSGLYFCDDLQQRADVARDKLVHAMHTD